MFRFSQNLWLYFIDTFYNPTYILPQLHQQPVEQMPDMIPERVYQACKSNLSVSSELDKNPTETPGCISKHLFPSTQESHAGKHLPTEKDFSDEELQRALECGKWGPTKPGELFLKVCYCT
jgi:hypothetical protein